MSSIEIYKVSKEMLCNLFRVDKSVYKEMTPEHELTGHLSIHTKTPKFPPSFYIVVNNNYHGDTENIKYFEDLGDVKSCFLSMGTSDVSYTLTLGFFRAIGEEIKSRDSPVAQMYIGNPLEDYFYKRSKLTCHKWKHYFNIYHTHFQAFRDKQVKMLEIGVQEGGSLLMWRDYFGEQLDLYGIDVDPRCQELIVNATIMIGDQADKKFMTEVSEEYGSFDIILDDGGHEYHQQVNSFEVLFPSLKPGGVYMVEDTHTSYWNGNHEKKETFMNYVKDLLDKVNGWHIKERELTWVTHQVESITVYDSVVVIKKKDDCTPVKPVSEKWLEGKMISQGPVAPHEG